MLDEEAVALVPTTNHFWIEKCLSSVISRKNSFSYALLKLIVYNAFSLWVRENRIQKQMLICSFCWNCLMLEEETLLSTENTGFPISHLLDGGNVLCGFLSWNIWEMNTLLQELTLLAIMFVIMLLTYQMSWKFLGWKYFQSFQTPPFHCRMVFGMYDFSYFSWLSMVFFIRSFCRLKQDGKGFHWTSHVLPNCPVPQGVTDL